PPPPPPGGPPLPPPWSNRPKTASHQQFVQSEQVQAQCGRNCSRSVCQSTWPKQSCGTCRALCWACSGAMMAQQAALPPILGNNVPIPGSAFNRMTFQPPTPRMFIIDKGTSTDQEFNGFRAFTEQCLGNFATAEGGVGSAALGLGSSDYVKEASHDYVQQLSTRTMTSPCWAWPSTNCSLNVVYVSVLGDSNFQESGHFDQWDYAEKVAEEEKVPVVESKCLDHCTNAVVRRVNQLNIPLQKIPADPFYVVRYVSKRPDLPPGLVLTIITKGGKKTDRTKDARHGAAHIISNLEEFVLKKLGPESDPWEDTVGGPVADEAAAEAVAKAMKNTYIVVNAWTQEVTIPESMSNLLRSTALEGANVRGTLGPGASVEEIELCFGNIQDLMENVNHAYRKIRELESQKKALTSHCQAMRAELEKEAPHKEEKEDVEQRSWLLQMRHLELQGRENALRTQEERLVEMEKQAKAQKESFDRNQTMAKELQQFLVASSSSEGAAKAISGWDELVETSEAVANNVDAVLKDPQCQEALMKEVAEAATVEAKVALIDSRIEALEERKAKLLEEEAKHRAEMVATHPSEGSVPRVPWEPWSQVASAQEKVDAERIDVETITLKLQQWFPFWTGPSNPEIGKFVVRTKAHPEGEIKEDQLCKDHYDLYLKEMEGWASWLCTCDHLNDRMFNCWESMGDSLSKSLREEAGHYGDETSSEGAARLQPAPGQQSKAYDRKYFQEIFPPPTQQQLRDVTRNLLPKSMFWE
ncbi:MAG: hypothetical protein GY938_07345, partial [Ketobacter sp.]|nr:hypothetical protein [Ketobacter sp.]